MLKRLLITLSCVLGLSTPALAQLGSVPFTFSPGTTMRSADVNANFSQAYSTACLRSACVLTGTITTRSLLPASTAAYDIGVTGTRYRDGFFSRNVGIAGTATIAVLNTDLSAAAVGTGPLGVPNGGTGAQTFPAGRVLYGNGTSPIASSANLTFDGTTLSIAGAGHGPVTFAVTGGDNGSLGIYGLQVGYNNNSGTPAAGFIDLQDKNGVHNYLWVSAAGDVRIDAGTKPSSGSGDVIGTVMGTQTSTRDTKLVEGATRVRPQDALGAIVSAPVYDFSYKSGAYSNTHFTGLMIDDSPWIGMDPSPAHPSGRSFNPETSFGYAVLAIKALETEIATLRAELAQMKEQK